MQSENSDTEQPPTPKKGKKRKHVAQKYRSQWENDEKLCAWIGPVENDLYKAKCKVCDVKLSCELSTIKRHADNKQHQKLVSSISKSKSIKSFFGNTPTSNDNSSLVTEAEIKLSAFVAEHNIAFKAMDHLSELMKSCFPDSKIANELKLKRTKCTATVTNVIGKHHKEDLIHKLRKAKLSVLVDESTDIACTKNICIVVKFYDETYHKIETFLWELVPLFKPGDFDNNAEGCTANVIYSAIIKSFTDREIPLTNIIGFASDGCNVMMGAHNSVSSRLKENFPGIKIFKCICHSMHLCASEACKELPRRCEDLARNIYSFFKHSCKRQAEYIEFQVFTDTKIHKILHPSQTRWLSLLAVVNRILEQWDSLQLFFTKKWLEERIVAAEMIFHDLSDPFIKLYFLFLQWILPKFVKLNEFFQSSEPKLVELDEKMRMTFKEILYCYLSRDYVNQTDFAAIEPENQNYQIPILYFGVKVLNQLNKPDISGKPELVLEFQTRVKRFLITGSNELQKRYDFSDTLLPLLKYLTPKEALKEETRETLPSLMPIINELKIICKDEDTHQKIDDEWRMLPNMIGQLNLKDLDVTKVDVFWSQILTQLNDTCENLAKFVLNILSLPHANADCERIFSSVNIIKTKSRNKMITSTISNTLLAKQYIQSKGNCTNFKPTKEMLNYMKDSSKYKLKKEEEEELNLSDIRYLYYDGSN